MPDLGPWLPDLPDIGHPGLTVARNVYATPAGYRPVRNLSAVTTALASAWRGGGSFTGPDGTTATLAGTDAGLYSYATGAWTLKHSGSYNAAWRFAQFGPLVLGVNGGAPTKYAIATGTGANLGGSPPNATMIAIVRDFVFLAGDGSANSTVFWSAYNDAEGWTIGTDQCDVQPLPDGGPITGLAGGEYGLVFQETAIHRFSYVGTPLIFQRDKISDGVGCVAAGSVATHGRLTFFLSQRGFFVASDGGVDPIGQDQVSETFWNTYTRPEVVSSIRCAIDPKRTLVMWSMPDRIWAYNWTLQRWTDFDVPGVVGISTGANAAVTLEGIDTLYPSGIDSVPYSLDDPIFSGGETMLTVAKGDNAIYSFGSSAPLDAILQLPWIEMFTGRTTRIRRARIQTDVTEGITLSLDGINRLGDTPSSVQALTVTPTGHIPIRLFSRYVRPRIEIASGARWTYLKGLDFEAAPGGIQ